MKATLVRALSRAWPRRRLYADRPHRISCCWSRRRWPICSRCWSSARAWRGTVVKFDGPALLAAAKQGLPLTMSLTLLAVSSVTDRFMIANLVGAADAGKYIAGLDLVRQTLMMPAISAAAAFFPLAVLILANQGPAALRSHLGECAELLLSVTLPACLGIRRDCSARRQCRARRRFPRDRRGRSCRSSRSRWCSRS